MGADILSCLGAGSRHSAGQQNALSMILPKDKELTAEQLREVTEITGEFGCRIQPIVGAMRTIYAIVGDERDS